MKKNNGITMISLVITIILLLLISSVTIQVGVRSYNEVKIQNFVSKLKVIQAKVDNMVEGNVDKEGFTSLKESPDKEIFEAIIKNPSQYNINDSWEKGEDDQIENYYYFTPENLEEKLGLKDQDMTVIINFETRNVISKKPLKIDGKNYYRQYDLEVGEKL